jgi:transcriptional regulator with XRE-family HTH domain
LTFDPVQFGGFIRRLRQSRDLSMIELAARAGVHKTTITNVELGKTAMIPAYVIHSLALGLGVQTSYLMEKAGYGDEGGRWSSFARRDQMILLAALADFIVLYDDPPAQEAASRLRAELLTEFNREEQ